MITYSMIAIAYVTHITTNYYPQTISVQMRLPRDGGAETQQSGRTSKSGLEVQDLVGPK